MATSGSSLSGLSGLSSLSPGAQASSAQASTSSSASAAAASSGGGATASSGAINLGGGPGTTYVALLQPANQSDVHGIAVVSREGDILSVDVQATGLTPLQNHMQHIHGFTDGRTSSLPTAADDANHDGVISLSEAEVKTGPSLLSLSLDPKTAVQQPPDSNSAGAFPNADPNGDVHYYETFVISPGAPTATVLGNLASDTIELHGGMVGGAYDPTLPVAGGVLHPLTPAAAHAAELILNLSHHATLG